MRRGLKSPLQVLSLLVSTRSSLGFVINRQIATVSINNSKRRMSSEVMENESFGETDQSWRSLLEVSIAKSRKIRGSNYVQIATTNENNEPRCRTVVFRGFFNNLPENHPMTLNGGYCDGKPILMKMCTDLRSKKVEEVAYQPISEMVWWFPKTSEQYRVRGPLSLVGDDNDDRVLQIARKELWGNLGDPSRESFLDAATTKIGSGGRDDEGKVVPPPANFLLMLLDPTYVDYLRLTGAQYRQIDQRRQSQHGGDDNDDDDKSQPYWSSKEVDP